MTAIPTNEFDAGTDPIYSVYSPTARYDRLIARNISYARARQQAEYYSALVFTTADLAAEGLA